MESWVLPARQHARSLRDLATHREFRSHLHRSERRAEWTGSTCPRTPVPEHRRRRVTDRRHRGDRERCGSSPLDRLVQDQPRPVSAFSANVHTRNLDSRSDQTVALVADPDRCAARACVRIGRRDGGRRDRWQVGDRWSAGDYCEIGSGCAAARWGFADHSLVWRGRRYCQTDVRIGDRSVGCERAGCRLWVFHDRAEGGYRSGVSDKRVLRATPLTQTHCDRQTDEEHDTTARDAHRTDRHRDRRSLCTAAARHQQSRHRGRDRSRQ